MQMVGAQVCIHNIIFVPKINNLVYMNVESNCFIPFVNVYTIFVMFPSEGMANGEYGMFQENAVSRSRPSIKPRPSK